MHYYYQYNLQVCIDQGGSNTMEEEFCSLVAPIICSYPVFSIFYSFLTPCSCTDDQSDVGLGGPMGSSGTPLSCERGCWAYRGFWTIQQSSSLWGLGINDVFHPCTPHCCRIYSESPLSLEGCGGEFSPLTMWEELDSQSVTCGGSGPLSPPWLLSGLADPHAFMHLSYYSWVKEE